MVYKLFAVKNIYSIGLLLIIVILIILKIPHLNLPFFWDEAWSYAPAVEKMYQAGPGLLPGKISDWYTRGHPLLFYFLSSLWIKIFGTSLIAVHSFPLLLSVLLLINIFYLGKIIYNETLGLISVLLFFVQSIFIAQSAMLLPEILMALLSVLTIIGYLTKKPMIEIIFGSLLVLTKETGIVLILCILLHRLILYFLIERKNIHFFKFAKQLILSSIPVLIIIIFFIIQKIKMGYFFYPEHLGMLTLNVPMVINKFISIFNYMAIRQNRNIITFITLLGILYLFLRKKYLELDWKPIGFILLFILFYILFSAVNFFTIRYTLSIIPLYLIICDYVILSVVKKFKIVSLVIFIFIILFPFIYTYKTRNSSDNTLGYINNIIVHKQVVEFCEKENWYNTRISTHFLMTFNLKNPFLGYLSADKSFQQVNTTIDENSEVIIISNIELNEKLKAIRSSDKYILINRFEEDNAWSEIYSRK